MTDWERPMKPPGPTFSAWAGRRILDLTDRIHELRKDGSLVSAEAIQGKKLRYMRALERAKAGFR